LDTAHEIETRPLGADSAPYFTASIASPFANGNVTQKLSRNRLLSTERAGSETQLIFAVTHPDPRGAADGHAIVMLASSELQSVSGAALTPVPEAVAKSAGITVPVWP
jgi:hypothetical protein